MTIIIYWENDTRSETVALIKSLLYRKKNLIGALPLPLSRSYKSNEDYVYVRGRGRGKYICEECGIRCKKPSMLKKHIRTHTDIRPYVCKFCNFAFKTKGRASSTMCSAVFSEVCCLQLLCICNPLCNPPPPLDGVNLLLTTVVLTELHLSLHANKTLTF